MPENFKNLKCPICYSSVSIKLFEVDHHGSVLLDRLSLSNINIETNIVKCKICEHHYMTPVISNELMNFYYSKLNSDFYLSSKGIIPNENVKEYKNYIKLFNKFSINGDVLEIGCGYGFFLNMRREIGYNTSGIEPGPIPSEYAKNVLKLDIDSNFLDKSKFAQKTFDLVIMIDVIEHIDDAFLFISTVKKVLKPGGYLFIGTGNIESLNSRIAKNKWGYYKTWEHVSFFSPTSMKKLLSKCDFYDIQIYKTSLQHNFLQNIFEFIKNISKIFYNLIYKNYKYHGITFDHLIVLARKNEK